MKSILFNVGVVILSVGRGRLMANDGFSITSSESRSVAITKAVFPLFSSTFYLDKLFYICLNCCFLFVLS